jgi:hypothetical protein
MTLGRSNARANVSRLWVLLDPIEDSDGKPGVLEGIDRSPGMPDSFETRIGHQQDSPTA